VLHLRGGTQTLGLCALALSVFLGADATAQSLAKQQELLRASRTPGQTLRIAEQTLQILREQPHAQMAMEVRYHLGLALMDLERFEDSRQYLVEGCQLARQQEDPFWLASLLGNLTVALNVLGDFEAALQAGEECLALARQQRRFSLEWKTTNALGTIRERLGDYQGALRCYGEALAQVEELGDLEGRSVLLNNLGVVSMNLEEYEDALNFFASAAQLEEQKGDLVRLASVLSNQADVHLCLEDFGRARELHERALELRQNSPLEGDLALSHFRLGDTYHALGEYVTALEHLQTALAVQQRLGTQPEVVATLAVLSRTYAELDRVGDAVDAAAAGVNLANALEMKSHRIFNLRALAAAYEAGDQFAAALAAEREAMDLERERSLLETGREMQALRGSWETQEKERQIGQLQTENKLKQMDLRNSSLQRNALIIGSALFLLLAFAGWVLFLSKRRSHRELQAAHQELRLASEQVTRRGAELQSAAEEIQRLEDERHRTKKLESVGLLAGGIAHDFNNILAVLLGNLSMARSALDGEESRAILEDARAAGEQAVQLTSQLLTFAKGGEPIRRLHAVEPLVRESADLAAAGGQAQVEFCFDADLWPIEVDAGQIRQVVSNLVINADHSMPEGGIVEIQAHNYELKEKHGSLSPGHYLRLQVKDQGVGMKPEVLERAFDPYFTTKSHGNGLGLAITHAVTSQHEGFIRGHSIEGSGTSFEVFLPAAPGRVVPPSSEVETVRQGSGRILVLDDEPLVQNLYRRALQQLGYEVVIASDGDSMLRLFELSLPHDPFAAMILDLSIPGGMGGAEALLQLKRLDPDVRAIVASGYSEDALLTHYDEAGFVAALSKPFTLAALSEALATASGPPAQNIDHSLAS
jgi:signal transduction histidine kinase/ActR/RegA family two-component response regulator